MSALADERQTDQIAGKCVLVVEDDYVLAREVCNDLKSHGAMVLGPAPTVHYAHLIIGRRRLDGAILDIKLFGEEVYDLVDVLKSRGVPIVFTTAYQPEQIDARYRNIDIMSKPLDLNRLRRKVADFRPTPIVSSPRLVASEPVYRASDQQRPMVGASAMGDRERWARLLIGAMRQQS